MDAQHTSESTLPSEPLRLPLALALRVMALLAAVLVSIASIPLVTSFATGVTVAVSCGLALSLSFASLPPQLGKLVFCNGLSLLALVLSFIPGFCVSSCGSYANYASIGWVPVAWLALGYHVSALVVGLRLGQRSVTDLPAAAVAWWGLGIGGSVFYAWLMADAHFWCASCAVVHMAMAVQLVELLRLVTGQRILACVAVCAGAGAVNAAYHHRLVPRTANDPTALLQYLRSDRLETVPLAVIDAAAGVSVAAVPAPVSPAVSPAPESHDLVVERGQPAQVSTSKRTQRQMTLWGNEEAPLRVVAHLSPSCPSCRVWLQTIAQLQDAVDQGTVVFDFRLSFKAAPVDERAREAVYLSYAAGLIGSTELFATMRALFEAVPTAGSREALLASVPPQIDGTRLKRYLQEDSTIAQERISDNFDAVRTLGSVPYIQFYRDGATHPYVIERGKPDIATLRLHVANAGTSHRSR